MKEAFEKIDAILQKYRKKWLEQPNTEPCKGLECISNDCVDCMLTHLENDINQVAEEYNNGWISADVELLKKNGWYWGCYVTFSYIGTDGVKHTECKYASIYWEDNLWLYAPRSFRTVDEVIAWKPIAPYQPKGDNHGESNI